MEATIEPEIEQRRKSVLGRRSLLSAAAKGPLPEVHLPFALKLYSSKRFLDVMLAVPLLILSLPLMFLCGIWIKLVSLGPVIYTQVRLGLKGKPYTIYKLRTMLVDCEKATGPIWSPADDRRIIWGGQFLRRWHLDELPQLWNVIIGDMSLIGPRPERPEIILELQKDIPEVTQRLAVRPGITGLAQVTLPPITPF